MISPKSFDYIADKNSIIEKCKNILRAYNNGELGECALPEADSPSFNVTEFEERVAYFTLPMSLNYRRNSTLLWKAAHATYDDLASRSIFTAPAAAEMPIGVLRDILTKHGLAAQPTRHTANWHVISNTVSARWGSFEGMLHEADMDFLKLKLLMQKTHKKGFPYLSSPKLFNYWCFILEEKCGITFKNNEFIDIAVDTHIARCSILLGLVREDEIKSLPAEAIAYRWRAVLADSGIAPSSLNVPLWFWSRNGLTFAP